MSWLKIDDGFEDHPKVEPLSDAAHRLWTRAACWCAKTGSNGFVPRGMLSAIAKNSAPPKRLEKAAQELVSATAGGVFEKGLWEPTGDGWLFHDWQEYQPDHIKQPTLTRSEAASVAGKASADARRTKHGTAQPVRSERPPNDSGTFEGTFEGSFDERRSGNVRRTSLERLEPPDPDPRSDLPKDLGGSAKDLTGSARPEPTNPPPPSAKISTGAKRFTQTFETEAPDQIEFTAEHRVFEANGIDLQQTWLECRDHRRARKDRREDWAAEFTAWLRREVKFRREGGKRPQQKPPQRNDPNNRYVPPRVIT